MGGVCLLAFFVFRSGRVGGAGVQGVWGTALSAGGGGGGGVAGGPRLYLHKWGSKQYTAGRPNELKHAQHTVLT